MPGIELSNLSGQEIRRLLAAAEQRDQRGLAERLRAELAARRGRGPTRAAAQAQVLPRAAPFEARFETDEDSDGLAGGLKATLVVVAAAAAVAIGIGWSLAQAPSPPPARQTAVAAAPAPAPPAAAASVPAPTSAPLVAAAPVAPPPAATPQVAAAPPEPVAKPVKAAVKAKAALPRAQACRSNRVICSSPQLMAQEQRMRRAYDAALAAGADPLAVDEAQARWRTTLAQTASRAGAAQLYDRRIGELEANARLASR